MYALDVDAVAPGFERIVSSEAILERVASDSIFTEGPVWNKAEGALYFTDIIGNKINRWTATEGATTVMTPAGHPDGMALDREGRLVVAGWGARTVWRREPGGSATVLASRFQGKKFNGPNDIIVKSDGAAYWTDPNGALFNPGMCDQDVQKYLDFQGVYRLSPDGSTVSLVVDDFEGPNGLCFSPDESLLYVNDTLRRHIRVFEAQPDGSVANGRLFYEDKFPERGVPDGMKVDIEGNVYCTGSAGVHVIDPSGTLLGRIKVPESVANHAWGDADWRGLYLTARTTVYRVRLNIPGIPHGSWPGMR